MAQAEPPVQSAGPPSGTLSVPARGLLIGILIWAMLMIVPEAARFVRPLGTLGFSADNDGVVYSVDSSPAARAELAGWPGRHLEVGDRIDLSGAPCWWPGSEACRSLLGVFGGMAGLSYLRAGAAVELPIRLRADGAPGGTGMAGATTTVRLVAEPDPLDALTGGMLALCLLAGVFVVWRAFKLLWEFPSRMTLGFFLFAIWFNPGPYYTFYAVLQSVPRLMLLQEALQALAQGIGYAGFIVFALRFPRNATEPQFRWIEMAAIPIGLVLTLLQLGSFLSVFGWHTEILTRMAILGGYAVDLGVLAIAILRRRLQPPLDYQRMRWVIWGCAIGLPAFIFADSNEATSLWARYVWVWPIWNGWSPGEWVFEAGFLVSGILAIFVCEAARKPLMINVGYRLQGLAGTLMGIVAFAIVDHVFGERIGELFSELGAHQSLQFSTSICSAVVFGYVGDRGGHWLSRAVNRRFHHASEHLREVGASLAQRTDTAALETELVETPAHAFRLTSAAVFRDVEGVFRRVEPSIGWSATDRSRFSPDESELLRTIIRLRKPVRFAHLPRDLEAIPNGVAAPAIAIPITTPDRLYAVAVYGPHETGDDIDPLEEEVLASFALQAGRGYEHSEMAALKREVEDLQRRMTSGGGLGDPAGL